MKINSGKLLPGLVWLLVLIVLDGGSLFACEYNKCLTIEYGQWNSDALTVNMEQHGHTFNALAGDRVLVRAVNAGATFNPQLQLIGPTGNTLATAGVPGTGIAEILSPKLTISGVYTILIQDINGNGKGEYSMTIECLNRPSNFQNLQFERMIRDTLYLVGEINAYRFDALPGDVVSVQMIDIDEQIDPQIRLFAPSGRFIAGDIDAYYAAIAYRTLPDSGRYTLIADDFGGSQVGPYALVVNRVPTDAGGEEGYTLPLNPALSQNRPNPFNPSTTIEFYLPGRSFVRLSVYNILGETVRDLQAGELNAGRHEAIWDGRNKSGRQVPSGIYFYRLETDDFLETRKMLLLK